MGELENRPRLPRSSSARRYVSAILCTISLAERLASTHARPAEARARARLGSRRSVSVAWASASGCPGGTRIPPRTPDTITSRTPSTAVPATGRLHKSASQTVRPMPSYRDECITTSTALSTTGRSDRNPRK